MPTINEIYPFGTTGTVADGEVLTLAEYLADPQRLRGHQPGIARQALMNTTLRQISHMAAGLAQFIAKRYEPGVVDDSDLDKVEAGLVAAINGLILAAQDNTEYALAGHTHLTAQVTDLLGGAHAWSRQQYFGAVPLAIVDGSIAWNLNNAQCAYVVLDRDAFLAFPTNVSNGGQYRLRVIQDAAGGHVLSYSAGYKPAVEGDDLPEVATGPGAVTIINGDSNGSDMRIA
jgi:hypothetical protein